MYDLLEDYLYEVENVSKPKVSSFNMEGNTCIYVWKGEYDNDYTKSSVDVWTLLIFVYNKKNKNEEIH